MKKISLSNISKLYEVISREYDLYAPIKKAGKVNFAKWAEGEEVVFNAQTVRSPKDMFFPQTMDLYSLKMQGKTVEVIDDRSETAPFVVFGVKPCDCKSFEVLDRVFLAEPVDTYYKNRREAGIIVGLGCAAPSESCMCASFGVDNTEPVADVKAYIVDGEMYLEASTDKGEKLLSLIAGLLVDADSTKVDEQKAKTKEINKKLPLQNLDMTRFTADNLNEIFNEEKWEGLSEACLACGTCTYVCPTCQCYDIRDFKTNDGVKRFRCWDSCMYSDFTKMSAGQPRNTQMQRFRQRFMHKLVYFPANNDGMYSCVGCGRCATKCPISMNIAKVIKKLGGKHND